MYIKYLNGKKITVSSFREYFKLIFNNKQTYITFAVFAFAFFGWLYGHETAINLHFNGVIEKIRYDEPQHKPYITIKGVEYELGYSHWINYKDTLAIGDSAVKKKGTTYFLLIKHKH